MFIGKYNKSVILTYIGVAIAVLGIDLAAHQNIKYAILCLTLAGICDLFDGKIARMCKRTEEEKLFGIQIDSLADMMDFIALPIAIFLGMGLGKWYHVMLYMLYTIAAIQRLGYFNIEAQLKHIDTPIRHYKGLPVTYAALIFSLFWFLQFYVKKELFDIAYSMTMFITALLFVLNIKIAKPRGVAYLLFVLLAIGVCVSIIMI